MSAFGGKADSLAHLSECPLIAKSGHWLVEALLALAYETDEAGEFVQPVQIRIEVLKAAAPFVRPKLAAVVQRNVGEGNLRGRLAALS